MDNPPSDAVGAECAGQLLVPVHTQGARTNDGPRPRARRRRRQDGAQVVRGCPSQVRQHKTTPSIFGTDPVPLSSTTVHVKGLISKPTTGSGRTSSNRQFYYVNGRPFTPSKVRTRKTHSQKQSLTLERPGLESRQRHLQELQHRLVSLRCRRLPTASRFVSQKQCLSPQA